MHYPCNYRYVPQTVSRDGDPVDVLVVAPVPLIPGVVVRCRSISLLEMIHESSEDAKVLTVPIERSCAVPPENSSALIWFTFPACRSNLLALGIKPFATNQNNNADHSGAV